MKEYDLMELVDKMENEPYLNAYALFVLCRNAINDEKDLGTIAEAYKHLVTRWCATLEIIEKVSAKYGENSEPWNHIVGNAFLLISLAGKCAEKMLNNMSWDRWEPHG